MDELAEYDYELPPELLAKEPPKSREDARLLVVDRATGNLSHQRITDFPQFLRPHDCLVMNNTRVIPAKLVGYRTATGGKWEGLFLGSEPGNQWRLIGHSRGKLLPGETLTLTPVHAENGAGEYLLTLIEKDRQGEWRAEPATEEPALEVLERLGTVPLPPYMERKRGTATDWERYQTTFARHPGAVAAPTAGLHFTPELLRQCETQGASLAEVTLHVGIGTFRPVSVTRLDDHRMHSEWCEVSEATAAAINQSRSQGGRTLAVGTTTVRTLESVARQGGLQSWRGDTDIFIRPPWEFQIVDGLLTNFHLPRSTLLVLISAFAGKELIRQAYQVAIQERYRFYSYGDAMLIL